ncbi:acetyltransferase GNAT family [Pseudohyphozyma bogoriensis]|nr:acetyltransferase GNAT family [Pseudohyphozyma bogoriensis]
MACSLEELPYFPHDLVDSSSRSAPSSPAPSGPTLPIELIDQILTHLVTHDQTDLFACCLTSRAFNAVATPLLYHTVAIQVEEFDSFSYPNLRPSPRQCKLYQLSRPSSLLMRTMNRWWSTEVPAATKHLIFKLNAIGHHPGEAYRRMMGEAYILTQTLLSFDLSITRLTTRRVYPSLLTHVYGQIEHCTSMPPAEREEVVISLVEEDDLVELAYCQWEAFGEDLYQYLEPIELRPPPPIRAARTKLRWLAMLRSPFVRMEKASLKVEEDGGKGKIVGLAIWHVPGAEVRNLHRRDKGAEREGEEEGWVGVDEEKWEGLFSGGDKVRKEIMGDEPHWYLSTLFILPAYQGRGVGTKLLNSVLGLADAAEPPTVTYLTTSPQGKAMYLKHGFRVVSTEEKPVGRGTEMTRRLKLPSETWLQIIEDLTLETADLLRCCLVSKAFRQLTLPRLYHTVVIELCDTGEPQASNELFAFELSRAWCLTQTSNLLALTLRDSTELASLPRALKFGFGECWQGTCKGIRRALETLLTTLPHVHELDISNFTSSELVDITLALEPTHADRIDTLHYASPSAEEDIVQICDLLRALNYLKVLHIEELHLPELFTFAFLSTRPPALDHLDRLHLSHDLENGHLELLARSLRNIQSLKGVSTYLSGLSDFSAFASLSRLEWTYSCADADTRDAVGFAAKQLSGLTSLKQISLSFTHRETYRHAFTPAKYGAVLRRLLELLPHVNELHLDGLLDDELADIAQALEEDGGRIESFCGFGDISDGRIDTAFKLFSTTTNLKRLYFTESLVAFANLPPPPPFRKLERLYLSCNLDDNIILLISNALSNITHLGGRSRLDRRTTADLSHFKTLLHLDWKYPYLFRDLLDSVELSSQHMRSQNSRKSLSLSFATWNSVIPTVELDDALLSTYFSAFPSTLEKVTLELPPQLWEELVPKIHDGKWCPRLKRMTCVKCGMEGTGLVEAVREACHGRGIRVEIVKRNTAQICPLCRETNSGQLSRPRYSQDWTNVCDRYVDGKLSELRRKGDVEKADQIALERHQEKLDWQKIRAALEDSPESSPASSRVQPVSGSVPTPPASPLSDAYLDRLLHTLEAGIQLLASRSRSQSPANDGGEAEEEASQRQLGGLSFEGVAGSRGTGVRTAPGVLEHPTAASSAAAAGTTPSPETIDLPFGPPSFDLPALPTVVCEVVATIPRRIVPPLFLSCSQSTFIANFEISTTTSRAATSYALALWQLALPLLVSSGSSPLSSIHPTHEHLSYSYPPTTDVRSPKPLEPASPAAIPSTAD